ncbi:hypothetical protein [Paraburkholderia sp. BR13444]
MDVLVALRFVTLAPAQPLSSALPHTSAMQVKRAAFFLMKFTEVNMMILSSARGASGFESIADDRATVGSSIIGEGIRT